VHRYAIWLRPHAGGTLRLVAPGESRWRDADPEGRLVDRALATAQVARGDGEGVPVAIPLLLDGAAVGAIEVRELAPQVGARLGRLQIDLLQFLADRLAPAMCRAALSASGSTGEAWADLSNAVPALQERTP
jgi:hypothetical protein